MLRQARLTVNRNSIPQDVNGAWYTSGIRIGTPASTTLGMKEAEMDEVAATLLNLLNATKAANDPKTGKLSRAKTEVIPEVLKAAQEKISVLLKRFPLYPELG